MAAKFRSPGVYIEERNAFPASAVAVETAIPVFVGYTEKAERQGKSLLHRPTRVSSYAEFVANFGKGFKSKFTIKPSTIAGTGTIMVGGTAMAVEIKDNNTAILHNAIRLFYSNGGGDCYILAVKTYGRRSAANAGQGTKTFAAHHTLPIDIADFIGKKNVFSILEKESGPTLVLFPDVVADAGIAYQLYPMILQHCAKMQNRFGLVDVLHKPGATINEDAIAFRTNIGSDALSYGAAYYPFLKTVVVEPDEVDFDNLDASVNLRDLLTEDRAAEILVAFESAPGNYDNEHARIDLHHALMAASPVYGSIMKQIRSQLNLLPPTGAIAGIYNSVDTTRGVWKAPANVALNMVAAPAINVSNDQQQNLNVDPVSGISINVIRKFPSAGTLVWGARTLAGNHHDWRYINVRRTVIMIEQSLKSAIQAYVFEPNDNTTWTTVRSMISNFLINLWKQGALAGLKPDDAFYVHLGLGSTMTSADVLDGIMRIGVMVAIARPAEFIVINFEQQQQQS